MPHGTGNSQTHTHTDTGFVKSRMTWSFYSAQYNNADSTFQKNIIFTVTLLNIQIEERAPRFSRAAPACCYPACVFIQKKRASCEELNEKIDENFNKDVDFLL